MNPVDTFTADTTLQVRTLARRRHRDTQPSGDTFAAAASGLTGVRDQFYGGTGRMPNTRQDDTRRQYNLAGGSGDRHLGALDLWTEREISRHLRETSEIWEGVVATWAAEIIQCGFTLTPRTGDEDLNATVRDYLFGWDGDEGWCDDCDARGNQHFWDLLTTGEETEVTDGDVAYSLDPAGNEGRGTVSIIEGDRILTPSGYISPPGTFMVHGVECDARSGRALRVFIAHEAPPYCHCSVENGGMYPVFDKRHPERGGILWSVDCKRYSSTRRQPWLSTAVRGHDEIMDVFVATRIALRNQACRSTYTKIDDFEGYMQWLSAVDPNYSAVAPEDALVHSPNPGDHTLLNPGEDLGTLEATQPGNNFDSFVTSNIRAIGLPLGMGIEEVWKYFDRNFSASRLSLQGTRRRYERRQVRIKRRRVKPILAFAIARGQAVGELPKPGQSIFRLACRYPAYPYIETKKDAEADEILRRLKVKSSRTISEERGYEFDAEQEELNREGDVQPGNPQQATGARPNV